MSLEDLDNAIKALASGRLEDLIKDHKHGTKSLFKAVYDAIYGKNEEASEYYESIMSLHPTPAASIAFYLSELIRNGKMQEFLHIALMKILPDAIWCLENEDEEIDEELISEILYNVVSVYNISKQLNSKELLKIFRVLLDAFVFEFGALAYHAY